MKDDDYDEDDEDFLDEDEMQDFMKNNFKFNIIFSVPQGGMGQYDEYGDWDDEYDEDDYDDDEEAEEDEEEEEEEEQEPTKKKKSKKKKSMDDKSIDDVTEEEWMEMIAEQEKEMKKEGTYYATNIKKMMLLC